LADFLIPIKKFKIGIGSTKNFFKVFSKISGESQFNDGNLK